MSGLVFDDPVLCSRAPGSVGGPRTHAEAVEVIVARAHSSRSAVADEGVRLSGASPAALAARTQL